MVGILVQWSPVLKKGCAAFIVIKIASSMINLRCFSRLSFLLQPVMPCNMRYPLSNYSIKVDNVSACVIHIFDDNSIKKDGRVRLELNETTLPGVTLDGSFNLTVTACNNITCKESDITAFSKYTIKGL